MGRRVKRCGCRLRASFRIEDESSRPGETVRVPLAAPVVTGAVRINITGANTRWENKIVMREIAFA